MRAVSLAILCLVAAGCRVDPNIVLLERENRLLEDRIYQLEDALARAQVGLDTCQVTSTSPPSVVTSKAAAPSRLAPGPVLDVPQEQTPRQREPGLLQPPRVLLPDGNSVPSEKTTPRNPETSQRILPLRRPLPSATSAAYLTDAPASAEVTRDNRRIHQIAIQPRLTGGYNADGRPGHEGITTFVQLLDAQGRLLRTAAPISVAVVDKAIPGAGSRVARWDYSAQEAAAQWRRTPLGEGVLIQAKWPKDPPVHAQLRLYVRLTTDDGRKLDAIRDIEVSPPQLAAGGWTPSVPKELPPQDTPAVPLAQEQPPAAPPPASPAPAPASPTPASPTPASPAPASPTPASATPASATPQVATVQPAAEPVEPSAAPILELPDEAASASEGPKQAPPPRVATRRSPPAEPAIQRPVWSPYRR